MKAPSRPSQSAKINSESVDKLVLQPTGSLLRLGEIKTRLQLVARWLAQNLILILFLLCTPLLLLQTWNIQHSCFPLVNWGSERCPIDSVTIRPRSLSLRPGNSSTLKADVHVKDSSRDTGLINRNVVWSSNDKIAIVEANGQVHALKAGRADITATSQQDATRKDTIRVSVEGITGLTLLPRSLAIAVGEVRTLSAAVQGVGRYDNTIVWSSANPQIATVDQSGDVHGVAKGTVTIQASTKQVPKTTATLNVTVSEKVVIDRVTIQSKELSESLYVGSVPSLTATVEGLDANSEDITWMSSHPEVIELDSHGQQTNLIARSIGNTTITAVSNQDRSKKAALQLTVLPPVVTSISLRSNTLELNIDEQSQVCPTVSGKGAIDKTVTWTSSNPEIATVDANGIITAQAKGTSEITATSRQDPNQTAKMTFKTPRGFNWLAFSAGAIITIGGTALGVPVPAAIALGSAVASGIGLWHSSSLPMCQ
jgi:uncharacterized protein YjdB